MKKLFLAALCLVSLSGALPAQDIKDIASYQINVSRDLWYNSANTAGLALGQTGQWRNLSLGYGLQQGSFTDSWQAKSQNGFSLNGDMLMNLGGFKLKAGVNAERNSLEQCMYNTSVYDVAWDMPFYVAMNTDERFPLTKSSADIDIAAASPLLLDGALAVGLEAKAICRAASRAEDIVSNYSSFGYEIAPSVTYSITEDNILGLALRFSHLPAQSTVTTYDNSEIGVVFLQGLGSYSARWAGGVIALKPLEYSTDMRAVALEYNHLGEKSEWLLEISLDKGSTTVEEQSGGRATGRVDRFITGASIQGLFGENRSRKLNLDFRYNLNYWLNGSTAFAQNSIIDADLRYTVYTGVDVKPAYDFVLGAGLDFFSLNSTRYTPDGSLKNLSMLPYAFLGKNTRIGTAGSLLLRLDVGYRFSANTAYAYTGENATTNYIVNYMFDDEVDYLKAYYIRTTAMASYTHRLSEKLAAYARVDGGYNRPMNGNGNRVAAALSIGLMF